MSIFKVNIEIDKLLRQFILEDGFDLDTLKAPEEDLKKNKDTE